MKTTIVLTALDEDNLAVMNAIRTEMLKNVERRAADPNAEPPGPDAVTVKPGTSNPFTLHMERDGQSITLTEFESGFIWRGLVDAHLRGEH
jgi:hypothetical protein